MNKLKFFKKYYTNILIGGRYSESNLKWHIQKDDERKNFISTFYDECPPIEFCGENSRDRYYILKTQWRIVSLLITLSNLFSSIGLGAMKYVPSTLKAIVNERKNRMKYLNPTKEAFFNCK